METFGFKCSKCGQRFEADATLRGGTTRCPRCGEKIGIPALPAGGNFFRFMTDPENRFPLTLLLGTGIIIALCTCLALDLVLKQRREMTLSALYGQRFKAEEVRHKARLRARRTRERQRRIEEDARKTAVLIKKEEPSRKRLPVPPPQGSPRTAGVSPLPPKTSPPAPARTPRRPAQKRLEKMTAVNRRLREFKTRLEEELDPRKVPGAQSFLRREILKRSTQLVRFSTERIETIRRRDRDIAATSARKGDPEKNRELQDVYSRYSSGTHRLGTELLALLNDPSTDPNVLLTDARTPGRSAPALLTVAARPLPLRNELLKLLIRRHADPAGLERGRFIPTAQLIAYGLPEGRLEHALHFVMTNVLQGSMHGVQELSCLICDGVPMRADTLKKAVRSGRWELLLLLLAAGYPPDMTDGSGETALFDAYRLADGKLFVDLLLAAGADPTIRSKTGRTAASFAETGRFNTLWKHYRWPAVEEMLKNGYRADATLPNGLTLLADACRRNTPQGVALLLKYGADPDAGRKSGLSARQFAERNRRKAGNAAFRRDSAAIMRLLNEADKKRGRPGSRLPKTER
ncbi:MAG: hypothetical protein IJU70_08360 [Lentisphaeria bacterium]|nr:hypothetical protein [Lentisphaeria bacterium]